jgi:hypothetical protein
MQGGGVLEELVAELMNLEDKTRSQWSDFMLSLLALLVHQYKHRHLTPLALLRSDFMRTISLGGLDPHQSRLSTKVQILTPDAPPSQVRLHAHHQSRRIRPSCQPI